MTDSRTLGQRVPKEGLFLMDGIEGLRSLPKHKAAIGFTSQKILEILVQPALQLLFEQLRVELF